MAATGISGIDIRSSATRIVFRVALVDVLEQIVTSGTVKLYLYELQDDGTLKSYDFNDNTFKTTTLTTETVNMTHRTGNNGATNTGIWTYALTTVTGFTAGAIYIAQVECDGVSPYRQTREFQFSGGVPADLYAIGGQTIDGNNATLKLKQLDVTNSAGSAVIFQSTGSNGAGLFIGGNGTGEGLWIVAGSQGNGIEVSGGSSTGYGIYVNAAGGAAARLVGSAGCVQIVSSTGSAVEISAVAAMSNPCISISGSGTGSGIYITSAVSCISLDCPPGGYGVECPSGGIMFGGDLHGSVLGNGYGQTINGVGVRADVDTVKNKGVMATGTVTTGATSTSIPTTGMSPSGSAAGQFVGHSLYFTTNTTTAALRGLVCYITASTNATNPTFTVEMADGSALPATPVSGDTFVLG